MSEPRYCVNCKHFQWELVDGFEAKSVSRCSYRQIRSLVTGELELDPCGAMRIMTKCAIYEDGCGPEGKWYEEVEDKNGNIQA